MEEVYAKFSELYAIHDWYFCENKSEKQEMMKELINEVTSLLDSLPDEIVDEKPAELAYIRGKALNALDDNDQGAEEHLSRAIKLDPSNANAWMAMGQFVWKKGDVTQAKHLFEESLKYAEAKEAYQDLSMITRQVRTKGTDRGEVMQESIKLAKKAISLDLNDHKSWYILGNAQCMNFFAVTNDIHDLNKALAAYKQSETLGGDCNPDLFYNRGNVYRYMQNYVMAIESYSRTLDIDPSFSETNGSLDDVKHFVTRVNDMSLHKAWMKKKKFDVVLRNLQQSPHKESPTTFQDLVDGDNPHTTLSVKVLMIATKVNVPPECFVCVDVAGECAVVSIFNLSGDAPPLTPNQVVTIRNPTVNMTALKICDDQLPPPSMLIQVFDIGNVKVDGRAISSNIVASPQLKVDLFSS